MTRSLGVLLVVVALDACGAKGSDPNAREAEPARPGPAKTAPVGTTANPPEPDPWPVLHIDAADTFRMMGRELSDLSRLQGVANKRLALAPESQVATGAVLEVARKLMDLGLDVRVCLAMPACKVWLDHLTITPSEDQPILVITMVSNSQVLVGPSPIGSCDPGAAGPCSKLAPLLASKLSGRTRVLVRADNRIPWSVYASLVSAVKSAGVAPALIANIKPALPPPRKKQPAIPRD